MGALPRHCSVSSAGLSLTVNSLSHQQAFFTWSEAVLTANEVAGRSNTIGKPSVRHVGSGWVLTYRYRPVLMNSA